MNPLGLAVGNFSAGILISGASNVQTVDDFIGVGLPPPKPSSEYNLPPVVRSRLCPATVCFLVWI